MDFFPRPRIARFLFLTMLDGSQKYGTVPGSQVDLRCDARSHGAFLLRQRVLRIPVLGIPFSPIPGSIVPECSSAFRLRCGIAFLHFRSLAFFVRVKRRERMAF